MNNPNDVVDQIIKEWEPKHEEEKKTYWDTDWEYSNKIQWEKIQWESQREKEARLYGVWDGMVIKDEA